MTKNLIIKRLKLNVLMLKVTGFLQMIPQIKVINQNIGFFLTEKK